MRATHCRQCNRPREEAGELSARALCVDCAAVNMARAAKELQAGRGPAYEQWVRSMLDTAQRAAARL